MRNYTPGCLISWQSMAPKGQRGGTAASPRPRHGPASRSERNGGAGAARGAGSPRPRRGPRCPLALVPYVTPTGTLPSLFLSGDGAGEGTRGRGDSPGVASRRLGQRVPPRHLMGGFPPPVWPPHAETDAGFYRSRAATGQEPVPGAARERCRSRGGVGGVLWGAAGCCGVLRSPRGMAPGTQGPATQPGSALLRAAAMGPAVALRARWHCVKLSGHHANLGSHPAKLSGHHANVGAAAHRSRSSAAPAPCPRSWGPR